MAEYRDPNIGEGSGPRLAVGVGILAAFFMVGLAIGFYGTPEEVYLSEMEVFKPYPGMVCTKSTYRGTVTAMSCVRDPEYRQ